MLIEHQYPFNKSIMVGILGVPNVGKSSLVNHLLGFDLSIVTPRPQTTRNKFHCVLTVDHTEIILVDTPGIHRSNQEINIRMNYQAKEGVEGADLTLLLVDLTGDLRFQLSQVQNLFRGEKHPMWVVFTKSDLLAGVSEGTVAAVFEEMKKDLPTLEKYFSVSTVSGDNMHNLIGALCDAAQPGPHLYPKGEVSNKNERFFVTEYIREQAFLLLKEELPYEMAVVIDEYRDVGGEPGATIASYISASILVNRPSQRAIVVGSKGSIIKEIGIRARKKIEAMVQGQVHLNLHVKVSPKWQKNNFVLEELGLPRAPLSNRVWRMRTT